MDPFKDCRRIYKRHFRERIGQKHFPTTEVNMVLRDGTSSHQGNGIYKIKHRGWTIVLKAFTCRIILKTVYRT